MTRWNGSSTLGSRSLSLSMAVAVLVNNVFADRLTFAYVGARKQKPKKQLQRFAEQLKAYSGSPFAPVLANWDEAFQALRTLIESKPKETRKVVFFDEMPWIDTPRSSFVEALEYFWNAWAAQRNDILFIACGSATSWMVNKLVKNKGGLHNRITEQIYLRPFRLGECEEYLHANGCVWDRYTILGRRSILYESVKPRTKPRTEYRPFVFR